MDKVKCSVCRFKKKKEETAAYSDKHICKPCEKAMRGEGFTEIDQYNDHTARMHPFVHWMRSFL